MEVPQSFFEQTENTDPKELAKSLRKQFNKTVYPHIEEKFHPKKNKTQNELLRLFASKAEANELHTRSHERMGMELTKGLIEYIIEHVTIYAVDEVLLEAMHCEMNASTFGNCLLDFAHAADWYTTQGEQEIAVLIRKNLDIITKRIFSLQKA